MSPFTLHIHWSELAVGLTHLTRAKDQTDIYLIYTSIIQQLGQEGKGLRASRPRAYRATTAAYGRVSPHSHKAPSATNRMLLKGEQIESNRERENVNVGREQLVFTFHLLLTPPSAANKRLN